MYTSIHRYAVSKICPISEQSMRELSTVSEASDSVPLEVFVIFVFHDTYRGAPEKYTYIYIYRALYSPEENMRIYNMCIHAMRTFVIYIPTPIIYMDIDILGLGCYSHASTFPLHPQWGG